MANPSRAAMAAALAQPRPEFQPLYTTPIGAGTDPYASLTDREARRLVDEVRSWASQFTAPDACALVHAMDDMERLLIRAWTEIDESLLRLRLADAAQCPERAVALRREAI